MSRTMIKQTLRCLSLFFIIFQLFSAVSMAGASPKILIAVTSHGVLGAETGEPTGYFLSEVSHAYYTFKNAGFEVVFTSPKGGTPPVTGVDMEDDDNKAFLKDKEAQEAIAHSIAAEKLDASAYEAIYFAGGHGVMWDFKDDFFLQRASRVIYEKGGVVSAVCHGPAGIVDIKLSNGKYLVDGKNIATFTNDEEEAIGLTDVVPFALETALVKRGAIVHKADMFQEKVVVDRRLVTGQNPASARAVAEKVVAVLHK